MAHKGAGAGGGGGTGIDQIAPPTGPGTAFMGLGLFILAIRFAWKHPKSALMGVIWSGVLAFFLDAFTGGGYASPIANWPVGLLAIGIGFCLCPSEKAVRDRAQAKHNSQEG